MWVVAHIHAKLRRAAGLLDQPADNPVSDSSQGVGLKKKNTFKFVVLKI